MGRREAGLLPDVYLSMGQTAENVATARGVSRARQDEWGVLSQNRAEQAIADGFDAVVMARPLIHDPQLVNKFKSGELKTSGCTNCNRCIPYIYHPAGTMCVLNPPNDPAPNRVRAAG